MPLYNHAPVYCQILVTIGVLSVCIYVTDLNEYLQNFYNIELVGGGISECLKEVEIALMVNKQDYEINDDWTY